MCQCCYELYQSLVGSSEDYQYDIYTAFEHKAANRRYEEDDESKLELRYAVGIVTNGTAAVDEANVANLRSETEAIANARDLRQKHFPIELMRGGVTFKCLEGQASVPEDKAKVCVQHCQSLSMLEDEARLSLFHWYADCEANPNGM